MYNNIQTKSLKTDDVIRYGQNFVNIGVPYVNISYRVVTVWSTFSVWLLQQTFNASLVVLEWEVMASNGKQ